MKQERAIRLRVASAAEAQGGRQVSRWTVRVPMVGRGPDGLQRHPSTLRWTRVMPVPEAKANQAIDTNQPVTAKWARVVPEPIFRKEWLERGGPPAHGALMCERDDGACVYVELPLM
jgi:hypothetical protein